MSQPTSNAFFPSSSPSKAKGDNFEEWDDDHNVDDAAAAAGGGKSREVSLEIGA